MYEIFLERSIESSQARSILADTFSMCERDIGVNSSEENLEPNLAIGCVLRVLPGQFATMISVFPSSSVPLLKGGDSELAKQSTERLQCRALRSDETAHPLRWILVLPSGHEVSAVVKSDALGRNELALSPSPYAVGVRHNGVDHWAWERVDGAEQHYLHVRLRGRRMVLGTSSGSGMTDNASEATWPEFKSGRFQADIRRTFGASTLVEVATLTEGLQSLTETLYEEPPVP